MSLFVDASALVAALTQEPKSDQVLSLLGKADELVVSEWVLTEFASALSIKQRTGALSSKDRLLAEAALARFVSGAEIEAVITADFRRAALIVADAELGIRGGDALHIATAERLRAEIVTLDRKQAQIAAQLGSKVVLI